MNTDPQSGDHCGGGGSIHIFVLCSTDISFEINSNSKEIRRAEHEYMNKHTPPQLAF